MQHLRLVWINLARHRVRSAIGITGIALGVAAMVTVVAVVRGAIGMFGNILATGSEVIVFERNVSDLFFSSVQDDDLEVIRAMPEVAAVHPVLFGLVSTSDHPVVTCFGLKADDPRLAEAAWLEGARARFGSESNAVVLGERAAGFLRAKVGGRVAIGAGTFLVTGIIRTPNGFEDGGVFMPLRTAREFFHRKNVSSVLTIALRDAELSGPLRERVRRERPNLIALENAEFNRSYSQFRILRATSWAIGIAAFLLGGLGVANTMVLSVFVRIRELAILKACGFSRGQVAGLIVGESVTVCALGAVLGVTLGYLGLIALQRLPWLQGYVEPRLEPFVLLAATLIALLTGIAGATYPARFAMNIETASALRYE